MTELIEKNIKISVPDSFNSLKLDDLLNTKKYHSQCKACDFWLSNDKIDLFIEYKSPPEIGISKSQLNEIIRKSICQLRCSHFIAKSENVYFCFFISNPGKKWAKLISQFVSTFSTAERELTKIHVYVCIDIKDFNNVLKDIDAKITVQPYP